MRLLVVIAGGVIVASLEGGGASERIVEDSISMSLFHGRYDAVPHFTTVAAD